MSLATLIAFCVLALLATFGAFRMLVSRHPVHCALYLVLSMVATAGIYLLLVAPFVAVVQVAVYAGAIMVLFLFIMMYLNLGASRDVLDGRARTWLTVGSAAALGALIWLGATFAPGSQVAEPATAPPYQVESVGLALFGPYALPFEMASLLLLVAMIGTVVIARPHLRSEQKETPAS